MSVDPARQRLSHQTGLRPTASHPPAAFLTPPVEHGGPGVLSRLAANPPPGFSEQETEGDIVNCESDPGKLGSLSVSSYSPYSMKVIYYVRLKPYEGNSLCPSEALAMSL